MPKAIYERCDSTVIDMANDLRRRFHPELDEVKARFDFLFAHSKKDDDGNVIAPAIMHQGYPAAGLARIIGKKDRAAGRADGEITLDFDAWGDMSDNQRAALLDHELEHFAVKRDKYGIFKRDDMDRPEFKMRKHTHQVGWFSKIAARWGEDSAEQIQAKKIMDEAGQYYWPTMVGLL